MRGQRNCGSMLRDWGRTMRQHGKKARLYAENVWITLGVVEGVFINKGDYWLYATHYKCGIIILGRKEIGVCIEDTILKKVINKRAKNIRYCAACYRNTMYYN